MFRKIRYLFCAITLPIICGACSTQNNTYPENINSSNTQEELPPINLTLGQAFTAQNSLFIKAALDIYNEINTDDVVVSALGLNEGNIVERQDVKLSRISKDAVQKAGSKLVVPFELPIQKITEFQLRCSWGEDAKKQAIKETDSTTSLESPEPTKPSLNPELSQIENTLTIERKILNGSVVLDSIEVVEEEMNETFENCIDNHCENKKKTKVSIKASVKNLSQKPITNLVLAFGLYWSSHGKIADLPKDLDKKRPSEEELSFGILNIPAGGSVPFNVKIAKPVVELPGGSFRPHIRILRFK